MSPVPLRPDEWDAINAELPDISALTSRIRTWPHAEWMHSWDFKELGQLRLSNVCFRDAAGALYNSRYALGQAIGVRKHFLSLSKAELDNDHMLADIRSRFYADYIPLLLCSCVEHTCSGILEMMDTLKPAVRYKPTETKEKRGPLVERLLDALRADFPRHPVTLATQELYDSDARKQVVCFRNAWVHNEPKRVETILYSPPRKSYVFPEGRDDFPWPSSFIGTVTPPDYTWNNLIAMLTAALQETADFLDVCADAWETRHAAMVEERRKSGDIFDME